MEKASPKHRQKKPAMQPQTAQTSTPDLAGPVDMNLSNADTLLYLQQTIGNQATQNLIRRRRQPLTESLSTELAHPEHLQRAETGLRDAAPTAAVAGSAHAFANDPANAEKHPREMLPGLMGEINAQLAALQIPPITISVNDAGGNLGQFSFSTWVIEISPNAAFRGKDKIKDLTADEVAAVVNTLHHESRHCEQWFRMARLMAGQRVGVPGSLFGEVIQLLLIAQEIQTKMGIPGNIALAAVMNPLYETGDQESTEARAWFESVYGANAAYRNLMLSGLRKPADDLEAPLNELSEKVRLKSEASTDFDREQTQAEIDNLIMNIDALREHLYAVRDGALQTEFNRLSGKGVLNAIEQTMLAHTGNLINIIDQIRGTTLSEASVNTMINMVYQLRVERYNAYHDLPEEDDAHEAGDAATAAYAAAGTPAPAGP